MYQQAAYIRDVYIYIRHNLIILFIRDVLCILSFCHLNLLDPWNLSPIYLHLGWVSRHCSLYGPSVYRFNIDPDIAALGRGGAFSYTVLNQPTLLIQMCLSIFSAFFWISGEGRARRSPVVHYFDYASLARGFLIFLRMPMRVVKSDWNPLPHACR